MILATPDFGAGGFVVLILLALAVLVLVGCLVGISRGKQLLRSNSPRRRRQGQLLILGSLLFPFVCYNGPGWAFRLSYGRAPLGHYPNGVVKEGMTADEVQAALGKPHEVRSQNGKERWLYWLDSVQLGWFGVYYGVDGRVESTGGD